MAYVYILKSLDNGKFYIGSTTNLKERLKHHFGGFTPSTKKLGQLEFIFSQEYSSLKEARSIEHKLKQLKRRDYIERIACEGKIRMRP